ncbi:hypothetical protein H9P43_009416 [Blastocladiella emersonii ATCC 22665]|nr:hypothetical protein H9P43_009416 [Blastocladiella emersonii ATCC 22665]
MYTRLSAARAAAARVRVRPVAQAARFAARSSSSTAASPQDLATAADLYSRLLRHDRVALAKAITLVESTAQRHKPAANALLTSVLAHLRSRAPGGGVTPAGRIPSNTLTPARVSTAPSANALPVAELLRRDTQHRKSLEMQPSPSPATPLRTLPSTLRIGLSGSPGVGKSTFIETFGMWLVERGCKVAVLAVDPSSSRTGGSILGDKTRMPDLSRHDAAYVRPSPARGTLGGVARNTCDAILLCEAAGYDVVLVETVGVGQSETMVADMVDLMVLLVSPAGGDELQGMKKGIVELSDLILVNKADGDLAATARMTQAEYMSALKFLGGSDHPPVPRRRRGKADEEEEVSPPTYAPKVIRVSAAHRLGIDEVWESVLDYYAARWYTDAFTDKREAQRKKWMWRLISEELQSRLANDAGVATLIRDLESRVEHGEVTPGVAADRVVESFLAEHRSS